MCSVLGHDISVSELRDIAVESELIEFEPEHELSVRFTWEHTARDLRLQTPADVFGEVQHETVRRLLTGWDDPTTASYGARALPAHAAAGHCFEEFLNVPYAVAMCRREPLLEGLRAAFPDTVQGGSRAADLHYVSAQETVFSSHADWVAFLHHNAMCWGDTERAEALAAGAGPLPWTTVWAMQRPGGSPMAPHVWTGRIEELNADPDGIHVISTNEDGSELIWDAADGQLCDADAQTSSVRTESPAPVAQWRAEADWNQVVVHENADTGTERVLPAPRSEAAVGVGEVVVVGSPTGLYAVTVGAPETAPKSPLQALPYIGPTARITPRPFDERCRRPSPSRLGELFGADHVHTLGADRIPSGITHQDTRDHLSHTGFPAVAGFYSLQTENLTESGLVETPWQGTHSSEIPLGDGPFYRLGHWIGGILLLDGSTGRVLRRTTPNAVDADRPGDPLAATTLSRFTAMIALQWQYMLAYTQSTGIDSEDLLTELRSWLSAIDPVAVANRSWQHVLDSENFPYL
ncbi:SUKH-4 family immunity protein [Streptomyces sp. NBC_01465]|uniref:SUKH-4 family immunity protein n=1 Tax=Streptomyces sp. NBC_01465 TaxID=2903878 RepID=UPI002E36E8EE|nr:SUKH-4 family immunity protein [Streptomyces sp. NBC_01465]